MYECLIKADKVKEVSLRLLAYSINWYVERIFKDGVGDVYVEVCAFPDSEDEIGELLTCHFHETY